MTSLSTMQLNLQVISFQLSWTVQEALCFNLIKTRYSLGGLIISEYLSYFGGYLKQVWSTRNTLLPVLVFLVLLMFFCCYLQFFNKNALAKSSAKVAKGLDCCKTRKNPKRFSGYYRLRGLVEGVFSLNLVDSRFKSKDLKNRSQCLPVWHSSLRGWFGRLNHQMAPETAETAAHCSHRGCGEEIYTSSCVLKVPIDGTITLLNMFSISV